MRILQSHGLTPQIWVAPRHGFDRTTVKVLGQLGITTISDGFARYPFRLDGALWIPQQLWDVREMAQGVWTVCCHPNTLAERSFDHLRTFLHAHHSQFTTVEEVRQRWSNRRRSLGDRIFDSFWRNRIVVRDRLYSRQAAESRSGGRSVRVAARIKIAYIIGSLRTGGAEGQLLELLRGLDRSTFDPSLIIFRPDTRSRAEGAVEQVYSLGKPKISGLIDRSNLLKFPRFLRKARELLRDIQPDVLHAFLPGSGYDRRFPCGSRRRSSFDCCQPARFGGLVPSLTICYDRGTLCPAPDGLHAWQQRSSYPEIVDLDSYPAERTATIYNGVDTSRFAPRSGTELRRALGWSDEHVVFGIVANFRPCKRHADFVSAATRLHREFSHTRFVMCGHDRGELTRLTTQIADAGLKDVLHVTTSDEPERTVYPLIDVYVCSSETEGFSNSLLEAMACRKTVIATTVGGNAEAVRDRVEGYLVPSHDPEAIAAAGALLVQNADLRSRMSAAARNRAVTTFSLDFMVKNHEQLYLRLLSERGVIPEQSKAAAF